ncbi:YceI family protein [Dinghuibacter silviterrae]|uniref:YceI-like domain-containing protein n=1 Tax=Dinghuibacter silviterrae TaxID=1539049 RepID=A0A4V3GKR4_9BACT|nr:YceI family protein [Dinghuibacter silviterrae]TDW96712.1 YceI-like domain-containing protein [Dinghuibacter silviterrae]
MYPRLSLFLVLLLPGIFASAQSRYTGTATELVISGTSTLHDWTMKSIQSSCFATLNVDPAGQVSALNTLSFSTPATALKSDHSGMDNNAYKALKTDQNPTITYTLSSVSVAGGKGGSTVTCKGKLTIAGSTRDEDVVAFCKTNPDNTITVTGTKKISMRDFQIDPPTFAFGTVRTGNDIVLTFHLTLKKA